VVLRAATGKSTLWHELVKLDAAVQVVELLVRTFPELVTEKDADRRKAYDVASQLLKERMTDIVQFCGRFEVASTRREHESATCIVIRAIYIGGWLPEYTLTLDLQNATPLAIIGASPNGDDNTIIGNVVPGGLADHAGWKVGFKVVDLNGSTPITSWTQLNSLIKELVDSGAANCQLFVDPRPDEPEQVVLKLMRNKEQYDREIQQRKRLDPSACVPVMFHSADAPAMWEAGVTQRGYPEYKYGIVMPAAERNMLVVLVQERVTFTGIRSMLCSVAKCLQHMHSMGKVHGDLKPLNVVRTYDDKFKLIDFDATVDYGDAIGAKTSTAYVPPELIVEGATSGHPVVQSHSNMRARTAVGKWMVNALPQRKHASMVTNLPADDGADVGVDDGGEVVESSVNALAAHPTFDIWSFAVVAYRALARELLFKSDDSDNAPITELDRLFKWNHEAIDRSIRKLQSFIVSGGLLMGGATSHKHTIPTSRHALMAAELLSWMLQRDPSERPQSFGEVLDHPFFAESAAQSVPRSVPLGATSGGTGSSSSWQMSALHVAAALGTLDSELDAGTADVSRADLALHANIPEPLMHRTLFHLAVGGGHVRAVEMLLDPVLEVDLNRKDKVGSTALHGLLVALEESTTNPTDNQVKILRLLFDRCDLELVDGAGRSAMKLGSSSRWNVIRAVFSRRVITQVERRELFSPIDFMAVWDGSDAELRRDLEQQLWKTIREATTRPIAAAKGTFLKRAIFPLKIWDDASLFTELQRVAAEQEAKIVAETHQVRDEMLDSCSSGEKIRNLEQITEKVQQGFPPDAMASLGNEFKTVAQRDKLEEVVIVPLLKLRAEHAVSHFANEMRRVLPSAEVKGVGTADVAAAAANTTLTSSGADDGAEAVFNPTVDIAPVKGVPRMEFKVREYRGELREDGAVPEATLMEAADGTRWWRPEALEQLGDCLRCTVECETGDGVWAAFEAIRDGFDLKPGNGRLKNNMNPRINNMDCADAKPPDMLINVVLGTNDAIIYPMVAEVQVHLAAINLLKHENHILYKVRRAANASELRRSTAPAPEATTAATPPTPPPTAAAAAAAMNVATSTRLTKPPSAPADLAPLGGPLPSTEVADAHAAEVAGLKAQFAELKAQTAKMAEDFAAQLDLTEELQGKLELKTEELNGMEELLLEQAADMDAQQGTNNSNV
jgi:serine/threonine protein kinase